MKPKAREESTMANAEDRTAALVARLKTGERVAQKVADLVAAQSSSAIAVSLVDIGGENWDVAIHFRGVRRRRCGRWSQRPPGRSWAP
jgi:hypothetical protein